MDVNKAVETLEKNGELILSESNSTIGGKIYLEGHILYIWSGMGDADFYGFQLEISDDAQLVQLLILLGFCEESKQVDWL